jgi:hypothetical protein
LGENVRFNIFPKSFINIFHENVVSTFLDKKFNIFLVLLPPLASSSPSPPAAAHRGGVTGQHTHRVPDPALGGAQGGGAGRPQRRAARGAPAPGPIQSGRCATVAHDSGVEQSRERERGR